MPKAGDNEKRLASTITSLGIKLQGKYTMSGFEKIVTSVDQLILHNGYRVLVEIDSYNMAKVVAGQYAILDGMLKNKNDNKNIIFIVVHCYKGYDPKRTEKHLNFINKYVFKSKGIPYKAYTEKEFVKKCRTAKNNQALVEMLVKEAIIP